MNPPSARPSGERPQKKTKTKTFDKQEEREATEAKDL